MLNKDYNYDVAIIGGGAGGFAAAISAAEEGAKTIILEGNARVLKKVAVTGNGQGNIANENPKPENYNNSLAADVFNKVPYTALMQFFAQAGIQTQTKQRGRVYPLSLQASSVVDNLRLRAEELNIYEMCNFCVSSLKKEEKLFYITSSGGTVVRARAVVVACGGKAYPHLSCGGGYSLLTGFGHNIKNLLPSLVQLKTVKQPIRFLKGIRLEDVQIKAETDGKIIKSSKGDVIFTDYGVSGIAVFEISGAVIKTLSRKKSVSLLIDILPDINSTELSDILSRRKTLLHKRDAQHFLTGLIPKQLAKSVMEVCNVDTNKKIDALTDCEINKIVSTVKNFVLEVTGSLGFDNAQVTAGGIDVCDFDKELMSKKCSGLFACGEILDVDGDCGGYNLMWAFSSGILCGKSCAKLLKSDI